MTTTDAGRVTSLDSGEVAGFERVERRVSHTTTEGELRVDLIDGLRYRFARPVTHDHGHLTEIFRTSWNLTDEPIVFRLQLQGEDGETLARQSITLVPRCPESERAFCLRICTG